MKLSERLIIGNKYKSILNTKDLSVFWLPENPYIDNRLSGHADLSVFSDERGEIFTVSGMNIPGAHIIKEKQKPDYPYDVQLNSCIVGNNVFVCEKYISAELLEHLKLGKWNIIYVNQGYTKCSILVVDENSIITSDIAIHKEAIRNSIDSLLVKPGYIDLEGFNYGFIGGCGASIDNILLLTGYINNHPNKEEILNFVSSKNKEIEYLSDNQIFDIGGIIKV